MDEISTSSAHPTKLKNIVIFDIDGTLANIDHRRPFVENLDRDKQDWKSFLHDWNVIKDTANEEIVLLAKLCYEAGLRVYVASGRPDVLKETTQIWLNEVGVKYDKLMMRKTGDFRKDDLVKEDFLKELDKEEILFIIDDRECVVNMWRKNKLRVLQCAEGKY